MKNIILYLCLLFSSTSVHSSTSEALKSVNQIQGTPFLTVGGDNFCDFRFGTSRIQDAIDMGAPEIRIADNATYLENLVINDKSITLKGGYANCTDAIADIITLHSIDIDGSGAANVVRITGASQRNEVVLENLDLVNGMGSPAFPGGGVSAVGADVSLTLRNVDIVANNSSGLGGGVGVDSGDTDISIIGSLISSNQARTGGGISCVGENNSIVVDANGGLVSNVTTASGNLTADGQGGGVYLAGGCEFDFRSGLSGFSSFNFRGIHINRAKAEGGGIYAESGAKVYLRGYEYCVDSECDGNNQDSVSLIANSADRDSTGSFNGGAIFATGADTLVFISSGYILNNDASGNGGGIAVIDGAELIVKRLNKACWDQVRCNLFAENKSGTNNGYGGAIFNDNAQLDISATYFEQNRADFGTAIFTTGNTADTRVEGSVFDHNGNDGLGDYLDHYVILSNDGTSTEVLHSTFADNESTLSVFGISTVATAFSLLSTIVDDANVGDVLSPNPGGIISIDCVIAHETGSLTGGTHLVVADPMFVDRNNLDYHINPVTSIAVDFCNNNLAMPENKDVDHESFGWDDPNVANIFGPFDVGADEAYGNDVIFENGFD